MPVECAHGKIVDWGDFGDDEPEGCEFCTVWAGTDGYYLDDLINEARVAGWLKDKGSTLFGRAFDLSQNREEAARWFAEQLRDYFESTIAS